MALNPARAHIVVSLLAIMIDPLCHRVRRAFKYSTNTSRIFEHIGASPECAARMSRVTRDSQSCERVRGLTVLASLLQLLDFHPEKVERFAPSSGARKPFHFMLGAL